jgi:hypothetical protein
MWATGAAGSDVTSSSVDQDIDVAEPGVDFTHDAVDARRVAQVAMDRQRRDSVLPGDVVGHSCQ